MGNNALHSFQENTRRLTGCVEQLDRMIADSILQTNQIDFMINICPSLEPALQGHLDKELAARVELKGILDDVSSNKKKICNA